MVCLFHNRRGAGVWESVQSKRVYGEIDKKYLRWLRILGFWGEIFGALYAYARPGAGGLTGAGGGGVAGKKRFLCPPLTLLHRFTTTDIVLRYRKLFNASYFHY